MRKSLRLKITLPLILLVIGMQALSGYLIITRVDQAMHHENHRRGLAVATDLAHVAASALVSRDLVELRNFVREVMGQEFVTQAMIVDTDCHILMHNNLTRIGEPYQTVCRWEQPEFGEHYVDDHGESVVDIRVPIVIAGTSLGTAVISYSHIGIKNELGELTGKILLILLCSTTIAVLFAILLAEYISRPIKHLSRAAEELAAGRFAIQRMSTDYGDELGELAKAFYEMAGKMEKEVCHDALTGLNTRNVFQMRLIEAGAHSLRNNSPLSVLMLDVDHFKRVNDSYGHPAGDEVLRQIAAILSNKTRAGDCVARYGGEEFVLLLPDTKRRGALHVAEKIRYAVEKHSFQLSQTTTVTLTISVGVAVFPEDTRDYKWLLELADQALYEAKNAGRNQVFQAAYLPKKATDEKTG